MSSDSRPDNSPGMKIARGVLAGVIAGAAAAFAMDRFQVAVSWLSSSGGDDTEPATEKAADAIALGATGREVPKTDKPLAGQSVHYALGIGLGVAYAVAAEFRPAVSSGYGAPFGIGTATLLDLTAVPIAGLGEAPWRTDAMTTLYGYASHLVFGTVAELVRRQVRSTLLP